MDKPRLFIGSSSESIEVAYAIQANLERDAEVTVWTQGVFAPSQFTLESLTETFAKVDFGAFVFTPEDILRIRDRRQRAVRDNVVLELGICVGALGRTRSFIFRPRVAQDFRLPTDLLGLTPAEYQADRSDNNWRAAVGPACATVGAVLRKLGRRDSLDAAPSASGTPELQIRAAALLRACEAAAGTAERVENRSHPEWRHLSVDLRIGQYRDNNFRVVYVKANYQRNPAFSGEKTHASTWYKWYIGIAKPEEPRDTYMLFEELPRLLRRPGDLSFEAEGSAPDWVKGELNGCSVTGVLFNQHSVY